MRLTVRLLAAAVVLLLTAPLEAQNREGLMGELLRDIGQVEKKIMGLANAMPEKAWQWRPAPNVRSTSEVFMHVAADNYLLPVMAGATAPPHTEITKEYKTAAAFEKRMMSREAVIAELEKSFAFLKSSMSAMTDEQLNASIDMFGQKNTNRGLWILTSGHLHEHLGQLIAYARSNNVTPPWSK